MCLPLHNTHLCWCAQPLRTDRILRAPSKLCSASSFPRRLHPPAKQGRHGCVAPRNSAIPCCSSALQTRFSLRLPGYTPASFGPQQQDEFKQRVIELAANSSDFPEGGWEALRWLLTAACGAKIAQHGASTHVAASCQLCTQPFITVAAIRLLPCSGLIVAFIITVNPSPSTPNSIDVEAKAIFKQNSTMAVAAASDFAAALQDPVSLQQAFPGATLLSVVVEEASFPLCTDSDDCRYSGCTCPAVQPICSMGSGICKVVAWCS